MITFSHFDHLLWACRQRGINTDHKTRDELLGPLALALGETVGLAAGITVTSQDCAAYVPSASEEQRLQEIRAASALLPTSTGPNTELQGIMRRSGLWENDPRGMTMSRRLFSGEYPFGA